MVSERVNALTATDILEQDEDDTPLEIAPDQRRVKTDKQDVPVETLHSRVKKG